MRLDPEDAAFAETGLHLLSTIRIHRLLTVTSDLIKRELGRLSPHLQARVDEAVRRLFALESKELGARRKTDPAITSEDEG